jgi:hypothetical protein
MASNRWSYTLIVDADLEPAALKRKLVRRFGENAASHWLGGPDCPFHLGKYPYGLSPWAREHLGLRHRAPALGTRPWGSGDEHEAVGILGQILDFLRSRHLRVSVVMASTDEPTFLSGHRVTVRRVSGSVAIASLNSAAAWLRGRLAAQERHPFDYAERARTSDEARWTLHACNELCRLPFAHDPNVQRAYRLLLDEEERACQSAFPSSFWDACGRLKRGDPGGLETAIGFLEADPWFVRSGYLKADLTRFVGRVALSADDRERLGRVVCAVVDRGDRREFRRYCRLARAVDTPALRAELGARLGQADAGIRRRSAWVLSALADGTSGKPPPADDRRSAEQVREHIRTLATKPPTLKARAAVRRALRSDDQRLRSAAAFTLASWGDHDSVKVLLGLLAGPLRERGEHRNVQIAYQALSRCVGADDAAWVFDLFAHLWRKPEKRAFLPVVAALPYASARDRLMSMARDPDVGKRVAAIHAIMRMAMPASVRRELLASFANDPAAHVAESIRRGQSADSTPRGLGPRNSSEPTPR